MKVASFHLSDAPDGLSVRWTYNRLSRCGSLRSWLWWSWQGLGVRVWDRARVVHRGCRFCGLRRDSWFVYPNIRVPEDGKA